MRCPRGKSIQVRNTSEGREFWAWEAAERMEIDSVDSPHDHPSGKLSCLELNATLLSGN